MSVETGSGVGPRMSLAHGLECAAEHKGTVKRPHFGGNEKLKACRFDI